MALTAYITVASADEVSNIVSQLSYSATDKVLYNPAEGRLYYDASIDAQIKAADKTKRFYPAAYAKTLLDKSDVTILRCYEAETPVPTEWVNYRKSLRALVSAGVPFSAVPTQPAYPANT